MYYQDIVEHKTALDPYFPLTLPLLCFQTLIHCVFNLINNILIIIIFILPIKTTLYYLAKLYHNLFNRYFTDTRFSVKQCLLV